ncbi:MAG: hypothetical protein K9M13_00555, partial [Simkaniaceae bacterium]|nr:hypothetical protein [Simkaniaceae bacterium]
YFCHPLLKSWEFTIASFADYQINAFKWNMIVALGFSHEEVGGIGKVIYDDLDAGLKIRNDELMNLQQEAERAENQLNMIQTLMSSATSEGRIRKLKADANAQMHHLRTCENMLQDAIKDTEYHSRFYQFLLSQYETLFHFYFQEIYDPEMGAKDQFFSQDSPAGFRLIYKHGRSEPDVWERIEDEKLYIRSLCDFFEAIPSALISACEWEKGKEEIYRITRKIIEHVQSPLFLRTAYERIQKSPFKGGHKTPWSYVSGANLQALVRCYFSRENQLTCEKAMAATEKDLCIIWIDQMKAQEQKLLDQFIKYPHRSLLAESPTHAFLFQPGLELFKNAWSDKGFTYTWLRDQIIEPSVQFYRLIRLEPMEQVFLINRLLDSVNLPRSFLQKFRFDANRALTLREFQEKLIGWLKKSNLTFDEVVLKTFLHGVLVRSIPFSSKENIYQLVTRHPDIFDQTQFNSLILDDPIAYDSLVHMLILLGDKCHIQLSDLIELFQSHKMIYPKSLYFADTNWVDYFFSFRINPITLELDLWRSTLDGLKAYPMINWKQSFKENGEPWIIYNHPEEYVANRMTIDTLSPNIKKV